MPLVVLQGLKRSYSGLSDTVTLSAVGVVPVKVTTSGASLPVENIEQRPACSGIHYIIQGPHLCSGNLSLCSYSISPPRLFVVLLPEMLSRQAIRRFPYALRVGSGRVRATTVRRTLATPAAAPPSPNDPFANGTNAYYAEEMYRNWRQDPQSVHASWASYFSGMERGLPSAKAFQPPPGLIAPPADGAPALHAVGGAELDDHLKVNPALLIIFFSNSF